MPHESARVATAPRTARSWAGLLVVGLTLRAEWGCIPVLRPLLLQQRGGGLAAHVLISGVHNWQA